MSKFSIYSKDGSVIRYAGEPKYVGTFMGVSYIEFSSIDSPVPISWERGDYVDYYRIGKRFRLYSRPEPKKQARRGESGASFVYSNVKFYASTKDLEIAPFRDLVPADNDIHFSTRPDVSTYENVYGIAARIQECMDDIFPGKWAIEVFDTSDPDIMALFNEQKEFSVSNGSCLEALSQIYETWKNVGWVHTYDSARDKEIITIGRTSLRDSENTSDAYAYGIGDGLTSLKKAAANEDEFATRLYVYGSERNIQTRYYNGLNIHDKDSVNIVNLMLPPEKWGKTDGLPDARKAYLQADDAIIEKYGLIPRTVYFDGNENEEIYPSITGLTSLDVRDAMIEAGEGDSSMLPEAGYEFPIDKFSFVMFTDDKGDAQDIKANPNWDATVLCVGFDIFEQGKLTENGYATISMKSGACAGREFKVKASSVIKDGQTLTIERTWDESLGMGFPNSFYPVKKGDQFVLLDIPMPDYYITLAQKRLLEAGEKLLSDYTRVSPYYEPSVDSFKIKKGTKILQEGMYMQVYDKDIIDTEDNIDYILIDSLSIDEKGDMPTYKVTLREQKRSGRTFGILEGMIEDAKKSTDDEIKRQRIYTDRRFRSAQETISMLQEAFDGYTEGINPVTIETMSLLVGNEALQFKFTATRDSLSAVPCPLSYNNDTKQLSSVPASLIHLTLGIDAITTQSMPAGSYMSWDLPEWYSAQLDDPSKQYYVYAKVSVTAGGEATYLLSETAIGMSEVEGYYHLLIGIINSEYVGARDFVTVYGFTEVLPGQITTDIIRDADSNLIIDLLNATITARNGAKIIGDVEFGANSTGISNLSEWQSLENEVGSLGVSVQKVQDQVDGVVENWNGEGTPTLTNEPAATWIEKGNAELIAHINDTYINIEEYVDDDTTPTAGQAWRWCQCTDNSITDFVEVTDKDGNTLKLHWHPIADSDAVRALKEAAQATKIASEASRLNLLANSAELVYTHAALTSLYGRIYLPFTVNAGETYTFKCELAENLDTSDVVDTFSVGMAGVNSGLGSITATHQFTFGENLVCTFKINEGVSDVKADLFFWKTNAPRVAKARFVNLSLVKGSAAMPVWQDYQGDNELKNLISDGTTSFSVTAQGEYEGKVFTLKNLAVDQGKRFTFKCKRAELNDVNKTSIVVYLYGYVNKTEVSLGRTSIALNQATSSMRYADDVFCTIVSSRSNDGFDDEKTYLKIYPGGGNTLTMSAYSLVRGSRPMMVWKENTDYLTNAFKNGSTKISGGLTMTQAVMVEDESGTVRGMLNGSNYAKDSTHGRLIVAAGSQGATAAQLAAATTRIYEDGHQVSNSLELKEGCKIGGVSVDADGLNVTTTDGGTCEFNNRGVEVLNRTKSGVLVSASLGDCPMSGIQIVIGQDGETCLANFHRRPSAMIVSVPAANEAFACLSGMFSGLRPMTRDVSSGETLDILDHNVFITGGTIYLPEAPLKGQTYKIYHYSTTALTINGGGKNIRQMKGSSLPSGTTATSSQIEVIELVYGGVNWYATKNRWE